MKISELPQEIKEKALSYCKTQEEEEDFTDNLSVEFNWKQTEEGVDFWNVWYKKKTIKSDPIVNSIIEQFKQRSELGISKYGTTLHENNTDDFLQHFKEELMDAILYIQKLQTQ